MSPINDRYYEGVRLPDDLWNGFQGEWALRATGLRGVHGQRSCVAGIIRGRSADNSWIGPDQYPAAFNSCEAR